MGSSFEEAARACCEAVRRELRRRSPAETIFFGPELADGDEPAVARLRARGAHFFWVAVPLGGTPFWDAHVGIVIDPATLAGTVGVHRRRGSDEVVRLFAGLGPVFEAHRLAHHTAEAADEEQWNGAARDLAAPPEVTEACRELVALLDGARERLAGAARLPSP